jgi:hypothetical protein
LIQYPDAGDLIDCLPATPWAGQCFEPEAHLLIEKFLSLKKDNSRDFIANVAQHTKARLEVSSILSSEERSSTLSQTISLG